MMVYCKLKEISADGESAVYSYGALTSAMNGEVRFFKERKDPEIVVDSEPHTAYKWIAKVCAKYSKKFAAGIFPEKVAYEC